MTANSSWWHETMQKRKSLFNSFSDRRSRRSLVYNIREAESLSGSNSSDPIDEKLDRISDDLHNLQNTLTAIANRVQELERIVSEKSIVQSIPRPCPPSSATAEPNTPSESNVNARSELKPSKNIAILGKTSSTKQQSRCDLENITKHELYRTVPKILVECCNLIEDHATIVPIDRLYLVPGDSAEVQAVLANTGKNDYKCLAEVKNIHTLASVMKVFFQELKYPVIMGSEIQAFLGSNPKKWAISTNSERVDSLQKLMKSLPEVNRDTLKYFIRHLKRLCRDYPKHINSRALATSISPSVFQLMRYKPKSCQDNLRDQESLNTYLQFLIDHCDTVFRIACRTKLRKTLERCISCPGLDNI